MYHLPWYPNQNKYRNGPLSCCVHFVPRTILKLKETLRLIEYPVNESNAANWTTNYFISHSKIPHVNQLIFQLGAPPMQLEITVVNQIVSIPTSIPGIPFLSALTWSVILQLTNNSNNIYP